MNLNYPVLTDANRDSYLKHGAVWERLGDGKWMMWDDTLYSGDEWCVPGGELHTLGEMHQYFRPVLPTYENGQQYYVALLALGFNDVTCDDPFCSLHIPAMDEYERWCIWYTIQDGAPEIQLMYTGEVVCVAGHGTPPELALWQQRTDLIDSVIQEAQR